MDWLLHVYSMKFSSPALMTYGVIRMQTCQGARKITRSAEVLHTILGYGTERATMVIVHQAGYRQHRTVEGNSHVCVCSSAHF